MRDGRVTITVQIHSPTLRWMIGFDRAMIGGETGLITLDRQRAIVVLDNRSWLHHPLPTPSPCHGQSNSRDKGPGNHGNV